MPHETLEERSEIKYGPDGLAVVNFTSVADAWEVVPRELLKEPEYPTWVRDEFSVEDFFRNLSPEKFRHSRPTGPLADPYRYCFPLQIVGDCLEPILHHGDQCQFDMGRPAKDGDIVFVLQSEERHREFLAAPGAKQFEADFGFRVSPVMVKFLISVGNEYFLVHKDGALELAEDTIVGVLCSVERDGEEVYRR